MDAGVSGGISGGASGGDGHRGRVRVAKP
jgi:hypothetical protein